MRINIRALGIAILLIGMTGVGALPLNEVHAAVQPPLAPTALQLSVIPQKLPADNNTYPAVVVAVVESGGQPTVAVEDVNVSLTSSQESVGSITGEVEIPAGETYAIANFTTTGTPGVTTVTATTTGLTTASAQVTTVIAVGYPTHLVIAAVPSSVPASAASMGNLILELEDNVGLPAKAIADVPVTLYSSNTNVVNITAATTVMKQGTYLKEINYTSGFVPGTASITATAAGFASGSATISVLGFPPLALKLEAQPSNMILCPGGANSQACEGRLVVALTDLNGNPTLAPRNIQVQLRSSDLADVTTPVTAIIPEGSISVIANFTVVATTLSSAGGADAVEITASSPGLESSFAQVSVSAPNVVSPQNCTESGVSSCSLAISAGPNPVLANHGSYSSVVVALLEAGAPAVNNTGPTEVTLTSSVTGVGNFTSTKFEIPEGQNWAPITFTSTYQVGETELTASAQNILPVQTSLTTYGSVPSQVVVSAISSTLPADGQTHTALELSLEDAFGSPAIATSNIPVSLSSAQSEIVSVSNATIPSGATFALVNVTAGILQGKTNVTALVTSFTSGTASSSVDLSTVIPAPSALSAIAPDADTVMFTPITAHPLSLLAVQLQDSSGNPARARLPMNITITSSNSTVISKVLTAVVGVGQDYASFPLAAKVPGKTTLTLSTPGLSTASIVITFLAYPNVESITGGPASIFTNQTAVISVSDVFDGLPLPNAPVYWTASSGGVLVSTPHPASNASSTTSSTASTTTKSSKSTVAPTPTVTPKANDTTDKAGSSTVIFYPSKTGTAVITALISPRGVVAQSFNFTVTVSTPPPSAHAVKAKASLVSELTTFPLLLLPIGGAGGAVAAIFLIRRRKGGTTTSDEEFDTSFE